MVVVVHVLRSKAGAMECLQARGTVPMERFNGIRNKQLFLF